MMTRYFISLCALFFGLLSFANASEKPTYKAFLAPPTAIVLCDVDGNTTESIDLSTLVDDILEDYSDDYQVLFYTSETDANSGDSTQAIDTTTPFVVTLGTPAQIWIRVQHDTNPLDFDVMDFTITVSAVPDIAEPTDYVLCNSNGEGEQFFDLTTKNTEILDGETATVTYYESQADAEDGVNAIATPENYESGNTTVYVRVENANGCFALTTLNLVVALFDVQQPTPYISNCDVNGDGLEVYDLTTKDSEILNGETATVTYHQTQATAENGTSPIANPQNYQSSEATVFVRVTTTEGCFVVFPLELEIPLTDIQEPTPLISSCDIDADGEEIFDLTVKDAEILNGETATVTYHETAFGAQTGTAQIPNPQNYQSEEGTIFVRITNAQGCFEVVELELIVHTITANTPNPLTNYLDPSNSGVVTFNLNNATPQIIAGNINPVTVTFYTTEAAAQNGTGAIANPNAYMNSSSPYYQIIYVRVEETNNPGCYTIVQLHLMVYDFDPAPGCPLVQADAFDLEVGTDPLLGPYIYCDEGEPIELTLTADYFDVGDTSEYVVSSIDYDPPFPFTGGAFIEVTGDDDWSPVVTLGFDFCFFDELYNYALITDNGALTFSVAGFVAGGRYTPEGGSGYVFNAPYDLPYLPRYAPTATALPYSSSIYGVLQDTNASASASGPNRSINYAIIGEAPCRTLVFNMYDVGQFSCNTSVGTQTSQIVIYETTNVVEVYIQNRTPCMTWQGGRGVVGIQNEMGTLGYAPPGRDLGTWSAQNEAWRFTPDGPSIVDFAWYLNGQVISNDLSIDVSVTESTVYVAETIYHSCSGDIIKRFPVYIDVVPQSNAGEPEDLVQCNSNVFDLTQVYDEIEATLSPTENVEISFHLNMDDLENVMNLEWVAPYPNLTAYTAISNPQTIYVRVQDFNSECYAVKAFDLIVTTAPDLPTPTNYTLCDDEVSDGFTEFDLTTKNDEIYTGNDFEIVYYTSFIDAQNELNQIAVPQSYVNLTNPQTIWVGVGSGDCLSITSFDLVVTEPGTLPTPTPLELCDDNNDGFAVFDLTPVISEVNGGDTS
ncbi:MAG: hypothetical protein WCY89_07510, partial [Flavobacteriaceae bacterium]